MNPETSGCHPRPTDAIGIGLNEELCTHLSPLPEIRITPWLTPRPDA
jgi:hypothetical protein